MKLPAVAALCFSFLAFQASAAECVPGGSLESGFCKELHREAPSGLELLQHNQHAVDKALKENKLEPGKVDDDALERAAAQEADAMEARREAQRRAADAEAASEKKVEAKRKAWEQEVTATEAREEVMRRVNEEAAARWAKHEAELKAKEKEAAARLAREKAGQTALEEESARYQTREAGAKARMQREAAAEARQRVQQKAVEEAVAQRAKGEGAGNLSAHGLPDTIWDWLPSSVKDVIDQATSAARNGIYGLVNGTLKTLDSYADDFVDKCVAYKDSTPEVVCEAAHEGFGKAVSVFQEDVSEDVQPIIGQFDKIIGVLQDDSQIVLSALEKLGVDGTFQKAEADFRSLLDVASNVSTFMTNGLATVGSLGNLSEEEKAETLAQVNSTASMGMALVTDFKEKFLEVVETLTTGLSGITSTELYQHSQRVKQPSGDSSVQTILNFGTSIMQKLADAFNAQIEGTRDAANCLLAGA